MGSLIFYRYRHLKDALLRRHGLAGAKDDPLAALRKAASEGLVAMPGQPGVWRLTTRDGRHRIYRIRDINGRLHVTVGGIVPLAVPVESIPGYWDLVD